MYTKPERARRIRDLLEAFVSQALVAGCSPGEVREAVDEKLREIEKGRGSRKEGTHGTQG
ncbi:MAG: hypothetical protein HY721_14290 [Planctomycetes bacterium]|nr:hypothetical protein [Planctomycetota bacterium]